MIKFLSSIVFVAVSASFAGGEVGSAMAAPEGKFVLGQLNNDNEAQQFLLDGATGRMWQIHYDSQAHAYLVEVPVLTKEEAKGRADIKPRGK